MLTVTIEIYIIFLPFSADSGITIVRRSSGKKHQQQLLHHFPQPEQLTTRESQLEQYNLISDSQPNVISGYSSYLENRLKMQPTSNVDNLANVDLTTESLPAVDTPDACDKAAVRYGTFLD